VPYKSDAQRRKFHALLNRGEIKASTVKEFDTASKGKKLPERVKPKGPKKATGKTTARRKRGGGKKKRPMPVGWD
jgi:hypothetical protein